MVFQRLGLPVAENKLEGPQCCISFLGLKLDSRTLEIHLPHQKLSELQALSQSWLSRHSCTKQDLESLIRKLAHASTVVSPGKTFMRRMFELLGVA